MKGYKLLMRTASGELLSGVTGTGAHFLKWEEGKQHDSLLIREMWRVERFVYTHPEQDRLCNDYWLHWYDSAAQAKIMDCLHGNYLREPSGKAELWEIEADGKILMDGTKCGSTLCTLVKCVEEYPTPPRDEKFVVRFGYNLLLEAMARAAALRWYADWNGEGMWMRDPKESAENGHLDAEIGSYAGRILFAYPNSVSVHERLREIGRHAQFVKLGISFEKAWNYTLTGRME